MSSEGKVGGESALEDRDDGGVAIEQVVGAEPTLALAAQVAEEFARLLELLPTEELRAVALMKLEGYTNAEIADRRGCALVTVERRLRLIRSAWEREAAG